MLRSDVDTRNLTKLWKIKHDQRIYLFNMALFNGYQYVRSANVSSTILFALTTSCIPTLSPVKSPFCELPAVVYHTFNVSVVFV